MAFVVVVYNVSQFIPNSLWRIVMSHLVSWWARSLERHLVKSVRNEDIVLHATIPQQGLPFLTLSWIVNNGSEMKTEIKRIYADLYAGDRRIISFDVSNPIEKNVAFGNRQQYLTVRKKVLQSGERSSVEINFYPQLEFWLSNTGSIMLLNGAIEIGGRYLNVSIRLIQDNLQCDRITDCSKKYRELMKTIFDETVRKQ